MTKFDGTDLVWIIAIIAFAVYKIMCEVNRHGEIMKHGYLTEDQNDGTTEE